ncbi:MAG: Nif3-like dinuclear metal center hexameric protein, partial [Acidobacteriota bacterium]
MKQHAGMKRRQFMLAMTAALAGSGVTSRSFAQSAGPSEVVSVQDVIDLIIASTPGGRKAKTVDTVKTGDPEQKLTGVATTFMATYDVIQKAAGQNLNLIITHEPTFYNHLDETKWLESSRVF